MVLNQKRTILIVGMGTSPAILTETVWELAHLKGAVIPDEIAVLTTKAGKRALLSTLLVGEISVWDRLLKALSAEGVEMSGKLRFGETSIRVIPDQNGNELEDLRTGDDNLRAADFMLQQIRQYTESPDTVVHTSIAGGRKTMSALLFSCMTLLGREDDKMYHVLLPSEFEGGVEPPFYFPERNVCYTSLRDGRKYAAEYVKGELFEVPYVKMRGWYQDKFKTIPPTYQTLVSSVQSVAPLAVSYPEIIIDLSAGCAIINGRQVRMSVPCFAMLVLIARGCKPREIGVEMLNLKQVKNPHRYAWLYDFQENRNLFNNQEYEEDLRHTKSNLRKALRVGGFENAESLIPLRSDGMTFPIEKFIFRRVDVHGHHSSGKEN